MNNLIFNIAIYISIYIILIVFVIEILTSQKMDVKIKILDKVTVAIYIIMMTALLVIGYYYFTKYIMW